MFETPQEVVAEIKSVMKELGLEEDGKVLLGTMGPDVSGDASKIGNPVYEPAPKWQVEIEYPVGTETPSGKFSFIFATVEFKTKAEARQFLAKEIRSNIST